MASPDDTIHQPNHAADTSPAAAPMPRTIRHEPIPKTERVTASAEPLTWIMIGLLSVVILALDLVDAFAGLFKSRNR
jgi:hypothetical protein